MRSIKSAWLILPSLVLFAGLFLALSTKENRLGKPFHPPPRDDEPETLSKGNQASKPSGEYPDKKEAEETENQSNKSNREIAAILYSDLSKEEMLEKLKPYVQIGATIRDFDMKTGGLDANLIRPDFKIMIFGLKNVLLVFECGIVLTTDNDEKITRIARSEKEINDKNYEHILLAP